MSDAYSFDLDEIGMRESYELFRDTTTRIFERVGLRDFISVQADSGAIGGAGSAEFMALSDVGEDVLLTCSNCNFGANVEKAPALPPAATPRSEPGPMLMSIEETPDIKTVEELEKFFPNIPATRMLKTIIFALDDGLSSERLVAVCIRGDLEIQEVKLTNHLGATTLAAATADQVKRATGRGRICWTHIFTRSRRDHLRPVRRKSGVVSLRSQPNRPPRN